MLGSGTHQLLVCSCQRDKDGDTEGLLDVGGVSRKEEWDDSLQPQSVTELHTGVQSMSMKKEKLPAQWQQQLCVKVKYIAEPLNGCYKPVSRGSPNAQGTCPGLGNPAFGC